MILLPQLFIEGKMAGDILGVKWNFHHESVQSMMQGLTQEDHFTDMTVVSGDEILDYQVHKFVLSAVSPVFKEILLCNPHEHPTIYLNSVTEQQLQCLLRLIYFGKTMICDSQVESFLKVIQDFQLTGLKLTEKTRKQPNLEKDELNLLNESFKGSVESSPLAKKKPAGSRNDNKQSKGTVARIYEKV